jgi:hypothetical protein
MEQFCLYPIERTARAFPIGVDDEDFDATILPINVIEGATIEDVSSLINAHEFEIFRPPLGTDAVRNLERIKYAIIHRFPDHDVDSSGNFIAGPELLERSQNIVAEIAACLRLIRPTSQHTQMCWGDIKNDGTLYNIAFNNPLDFVDAPQNQKLFRVRTSDLHELIFYAPLFRAAMHGPNWKYRMAVQMHEAGHFQNTNWKARFFLWTSALESLFSSQTRDRQHAGSLVASERVKFLLGENSPIYPPGELTSLQKNPNLTVGAVIRELYCPRNHIAHGDKVPDCYFMQLGRDDFDGGVPRWAMLVEAINFIVRQSLLTILKQGIVHHFEDGPSSQSYFTIHRLTKRDLGRDSYRCPN